MEKSHGSNRCSDKTKTDMGHIDKYDTFKDLGKNTPAPFGQNYIWVHLVYNIKHAGCHKARLVADVHFTYIPVESVYSGIVSLRDI